MARLLVSRLLQSLVALWGVTVVIFVVTRASGDPALLLVPPQATDDEVAEVRKDLGLDESYLVQYGRFLQGAVQLDFGDSYRNHRPAMDLVKERMPATLQLAIGAFAFAVLVAVPVGVLSAVHPGGWFDRFGKAVALLGQAMPGFWLGLLLILFFSVRLGWLPTGGRDGPDSYVLPIVTLSSYLVAVLVRLIRSAMLEVLRSEYVKFARLRGLPEYSVVMKHAFKNAAIPIVTVAALLFAAFLTGAVVTETVFAWPGIGRLAVASILARDFPVVQAIVLLSAALYITTNFLVDLAYLWIDPRIRFSR
ncbi:MAG: ABC transporter permease [Dehalococcoidia bacterium]|nr:ABC transporter permease [Dehalococcoidia bacterium]